MDISTLLSGSNAYDFIRGPLVWISFIVFFLGLIFQVFRFISMTEKIDHSVYNPRPRTKLPKLSLNAETISRFLTKTKLSIVGVNPVMVIVTTLFHICLVVAPLFLLAHNILLKDAIGVSLFSFSDCFADYLTLILMACGLYFLLRRFFVARVRAITTRYDYVMLFLATAPFITGYLAYHQLLPDYYRLVISLHILSGELMLMAVPFTKFVHMVFFFVFRFSIESEYSLGKGNRTW
ncbi:MAG: respiratory nitrate reductase subunit gamma [Proteobacteria bacterium]|nr:respiratory nitrate reductase subunit gamma [Pseudomonadota bacterium]